MADFNPAFEKTVRRWEAFKLTNHAGDHGRQTYAGISRRWWPQWPGWFLVDAKKPVPEEFVADFYRTQFWECVEGDAIRHQDVAEIIFDWAVNAGLPNAVRMTMDVLGLPPGLGIQAAVRELRNLHSPRLFVTEYALRRIAHRATVLKRDPTQVKFIKGWINRDLSFALEGG